MLFCFIVALLCNGTCSVTGGYIAFWGAQTDMVRQLVNPILDLTMLIGLNKFEKLNCFHLSFKCFAEECVAVLVQIQPGRLPNTYRLSLKIGINKLCVEFRSEQLFF